MKIICVDDEKLVLDYTLGLCRDLPQIDEVKGFTAAADALAWLDTHAADIALLDINMPGMDGRELAAAIKTRNPQTAVVFLTGYAEYAVEAFALRANGYLLKPIDRDRLAEEVKYALSTRPSRAPAHITAQTFGYFELLVDGESVAFKRSASKELLAFLVHNRGGSVTREQAWSELWPNQKYDRPAGKKMDVIVRSLRDTLREYGVSEIFEMKSGTLRVRPELLDCDLYRYLDGDADAVNSYRGEYMKGCPWARLFKDR